MSKKKNTTTPTPHDAVFRSFLANPDVARDFLELHLPAEYRQLCDLSTLKLEPATFVERCTSHKTFCRRRQKLLRLPPDNCPVTW